MEAMRFEWPLVSRWTYEQTRRENVLLREAIKAANAELVKHRRLLVELKEARPTAMSALDRAMSQAKR